MNPSKWNGHNTRDLLSNLDNWCSSNLPHSNKASPQNNEPLKKWSKEMVSGVTPTACPSPCVCVCVWVWVCVNPPCPSDLMIFWPGEEVAAVSGSARRRRASGALAFLLWRRVMKPTLWFLVRPAAPLRSLARMDLILASTPQPRRV